MNKMKIKFDNDFTTPIYPSLLLKNISLYDKTHDITGRITNFYIVLCGALFGAYFTILNSNGIFYNDKHVIPICILHTLFTISLYLLTDFSASYGLLRRRIEKAIYVSAIENEINPPENMLMFDPCKKELIKYLNGKFLPGSNYTHFLASWFLWFLSSISTISIMLCSSGSKIYPLSISCFIIATSILIIGNINRSINNKTINFYNKYNTMYPIQMPPIYPIKLLELNRWFFPLSQADPKLFNSIKTLCVEVLIKLDLLNRKV